jgi:hypothetical protein
LFSAFQSFHHQRMEYISQLIRYSKPCSGYSNFWTELSCLRKSYSNNATLLLGWSHRYKNATVVITIWWTVTKYPNLKWQWIVHLLRKCFLPLTLSRLIRSRKCVPWIHLRFFGGVRVTHIVSFLCCLIMCLYVHEFRVEISANGFRLRLCSSLPPVILFMLFVFACAWWCDCPTQLCCVFGLLCVMCTLSCQFLRIVHFWLPFCII